jgi:hypothetical protein
MGLSSSNRSCMWAEGKSPDEACPPEPLALLGTAARPPLTWRLHAPAGLRLGERQESGAASIRPPWARTVRPEQPRHSATAN